MTYTEDFANAIWTKQTATVSGTIITPTGGGSAYDNRIFQPFNAVADTTYTISVRAKGTGKLTIALQNVAGQVFDLTSEYQTFTLTYSNLATLSRNVNIYAGEVTFSTGAVISSNAIDVLWVQAETGSTATAYQKVVTSADITEPGQSNCYYLQPDGVNDGYVTGSNLDLSGTDKVTVFASVRKLSDVTTGTIATQLNGSTNDWILSAPGNDGADSYSLQSRGDGSARNVTATGFAAPVTSIVTGIAAITPEQVTIRVNGTQIATNTSSQGSGNYRNEPLQIFKRTDTIRELNGQCFALIVAGGSYSTATIQRVEQILSKYTPGVTL